MCVSVRGGCKSTMNVGLKVGYLLDNWHFGGVFFGICCRSTNDSNASLVA